MTTPTITVLYVTTHQTWHADTELASRAIHAGLVIDGRDVSYSRRVRTTCYYDDNLCAVHPSLLPLVEKAVTEALGRAALAGVR